MAAARSIGHSMADAGLPLLRYKIQSGGLDNEVAAECFASLIQINAEKSIPFLAPYLDSPDAALRDGAALALGGTRRPEAFSLLHHCYNTRMDPEFRPVLLLSMAMLEGLLNCPAPEPFVPNKTVLAPVMSSKRMTLLASPCIA